MLSSLPEALIEHARSAHDTPGRVYHTFDHVRELLDWVARVARDVGWKRPVEIALAALYHDAVYEPGRSDNEARSAELAREAVARFGVGGVDAARVSDLILLTARHGGLHPSDVDEEAALFLDADMAILGADAARFDTYDADIAREFSAIPPELYAVGRRRFLEKLLASPRIFLSSYFHDRLEAAARANVARALGR